MTALSVVALQEVSPYHFQHDGFPKSWTVDRVLDTIEDHHNARKEVLFFVQTHSHLHCMPAREGACTHRGKTQGRSNTNQVRLLTSCA